MIQKIFTVFDSKAEAYLQPFFAQSTGVAIRIFQSAANDTDHQFNRYAADFTLFEIGTFDIKSGQIEMLDAHINLGTALTLIDPQERK